LKQRLLICFCLFLCSACFCQEAGSSLPLVKILRGRIADFTVDNLGNIFLLDSSNQLKKLSPAGDSVAIYNNVKKFGRAYAIDASNPLKILVYYKDFATVVVLDRLLGVRNIVDLRSLNIFQAGTVCQSFDNGIWVYDEVEARLKRIADDGSIVDQTGDFRQQLGEAPTPSAMEDHDRLLYLYDSSRGLMVFDYFGTLKSKLAFTGWQDFQMAGKYIIGRKGTLLERYQLSSLSLEEKKLPEVLADIKKMRISGDRLYCLRSGQLFIYSL